MSDAAQQAISDLLLVMARLRDPETGCPWDLKQSYASIAPSTLEEAYEVVDAIESGDLAQLKDELGDLLFQVVFYAQLGKEEGAFDFAGVARAIADKLLRRHPHVFPDGTLASRIDPNNRPSDTRIKQQWESIKQQERNTKGKAGVLADIPVALPSISRAAKLQKRAALVGFDWPNVDGVFAKIDEELQELRSAMAAGETEQIYEEVGDLLFTVVNLSRHLHVEAEAALRDSSRKFSNRFEWMEAFFRAEGISVESATPEQWDAAWNHAKKKAAAFQS